MQVLATALAVQRRVQLQERSGKRRRIGCHAIDIVVGTHDRRAAFVALEPARQHTVDFDDAMRLRQDRRVLQVAIGRKLDEFARRCVARLPAPRP